MTLTRRTKTLRVPFTRALTRALPRALAALAITTTLTPAALAAHVEGEVVLPPAGVEEPEPRHLGYMQRVKTPIAELRPYDPRPECFVFLDGAAPDGGPTGGVTWTLGSASFSPPLQPVIKGQPVVVKNTGKVTHPLFSPDQPDLFGGEVTPVGPGGDRRATIAEVEKAIRIRSREAPHVEGRLVALPHRLFARIGRDGAFRVADVPAGRYTAKLWCKDGWTTVKVPVEAGPRDVKGVRMVVPERLSRPEPKAEPK